MVGGGEEGGGGEKKERRGKRDKGLKHGKNEGNEGWGKWRGGERRRWSVCGQFGWCVFVVVVGGGGCCGCGGRGGGVGVVGVVLGLCLLFFGRLRIQPISQSWWGNNEGKRMNKKL